MIADNMLPDTWKIQALLAEQQDLKAYF